MAGASHALAPDTVGSGDATSKPVAEIMVPDEGFEPPTFGLQNRCTTTVLIRRIIASIYILRLYLRQYRTGYCA